MTSKTIDPTQVKTLEHGARAVTEASHIALAFGRDNGAAEPWEYLAELFGDWIANGIDTRGAVNAFDECERHVEQLRKQHPGDLARLNEAEALLGAARNAWAERVISHGHIARRPGSL